MRDLSRKCERCSVDRLHRKRDPDHRGGKELCEHADYAKVFSECEMRSRSARSSNE
jgi:hypothetical protein